MRAKSFLLLIIAIGCGVVASVAVSQVVLEQKNGAEPVQSVGILVVAKDVSPMSKISADSFRVEQWPQEKVPVGAITDPKAIEGKYTKQRLYQGEPIIEAKLSTKGKDIIIPDGYRVFDLSLQEGNGSQGYLGPGDRVDIKGFFEKGNRFPISKSVTVMENLEVLMVDGVAYRDPDAAAKSIRTIQLLVRDSQYEALDTANNLGKLRVALRPPATDSSKSAARQDDGENFLSWLKENEANSKPEISAPVSPTPFVVQDLPEQHDMVFYTSNGTVIYRWTEGKNTPEKIEGGISDNPIAAPAPTPSYPSSYKQPIPPPAPNSRARSSDVGSSGLSLDTGLLGGQNQPNVSSDPTSGLWQSGGFKATYPTSK